MVFKKILVPYDQSENARDALGIAVRMVEESPETRLRVISVVNSSSDPSAKGADSANLFAGVPAFLMDNEVYRSVVERSLEAETEKLRAEIEQAVESVSSRTETEAVFNVNIAEAIVADSRECGCDLIVMGSRGLGALRGALGSVSYSVLHGADVPVMTVK